MKRRAFLYAAAGFPVLWSIRLSGADAEAPWTLRSPIPIRTQEIYPAFHSGRVIVAGGIASKAGVPYFTKEVYAYDPDGDRWSSLPELPEALHHVALVSTGDDLLAVGGFNGGYTQVWRMRDEVYRLQDDAWVRHSILPTPQAEGVVSFHDGRVSIVTGQQPKGTDNRLRSDHREGSLHWVWDGAGWTSLAPVPTPRNSATGGWLADQLVIAGGRTAAGNLAVTEIYDPDEDRWRQAAPMPLPQAGTASVVDGDSLIVFGGEIFVPEADVFANVWRYELATDRWTALPDMRTPRHGLGAVKVGSRVYVMGGATRPGGRGTSDLNEMLELLEAAGAGRDSA